MKKAIFAMLMVLILVISSCMAGCTDPFHYKVHFYTAWPDIDINN